MMPVRTVQSSPGNRVLVHTCDHPGCEEWGCTGFGVNLRRALETGDVKHAGKWFCPEHLPQESERRG